MNNFYDLLQMLKSFDIIIYMKNRSYMLQIIEFEVRELYRTGLIDQATFLRSIAIIKQEEKNIN